MGAKKIPPPGFEPLIARSTTNRANQSCESLNSAMLKSFLYWKQALLRSNRDHSKMKNESVKKLLEKSKNVLDEKRKIVKQKTCIKRHTFRIIAMNFVQEQVKIR